MKEFSVSMALVDFLPVLLFAVAVVLLQRDLYNKMSKGAFALFAAGTIDIVIAGTLKALYKLLYALSVCDFASLSNLFFPLQSIGALLAGIGIIAMLTHRQTEARAAIAAPAAFSGTFLFVGLMIAGFGCLTLSLIPLAKKLKKPAAIVLLIVAFVLLLGMGYLSSKSFERAALNWLAEGVNILAQASFLLAALILHRAGLKALSRNDRFLRESILSKLPCDDKSQGSLLLCLFDFQRPLIGFGLLLFRKRQL